MTWKHLLGVMKQCLTLPFSLWTLNIIYNFNIRVSWITGIALEIMFDEPWCCCYFRTCLFGWCLQQNFVKDLIIFCEIGVLMVDIVEALGVKQNKIIIIFCCFPQFLPSFPHTLCAHYLNFSFLWNMSPVR